MGEVDRERLDRIDRFLERFGDTSNPVCVSCLTEFAEGVPRCSDCHGLLAAGPVAVRELRAVVARGRESGRLAASRAHDALWRARERVVHAHAQPQPDDEVGETPREGDACPRCGTPFDPDVDVEGCENCRQLELRESEKMVEDVDPDPDEVAAVDRFKRFLERETDPGFRYCPGCLNEFRPELTACLKCTKELMSADDARTFARRTVEDLTAHWFVPVMEDADAEFVELVLGALDEEATQVELRVKRTNRDFSPITAVWRSYRTQYFARRAQLPGLRRLLAGVDLGAEFADRQRALVEHLDRLIEPGH